MIDIIGFVSFFWWLLSGGIALFEVQTSDFTESSCQAQESHVTYGGDSWNPIPADIKGIINEGKPVLQL
jgi:hypothetical protein